MEDKKYFTYEEVERFTNDFDNQDGNGWIMDILNGDINISALKYVIKNPGKYDDIGFVFKEPEKVGWGFYTKEKDKNRKA
jgi:hypothetical protein|tara:strand:+ start:533 stop:772 length:240 start_codon:yes stop_codon:yes gene_type:complete